MQEYKYKAVNDSGRRITGLTLAENELDLEGRVTRMGLTFISGTVQQRKEGRLISRSISRPMIINFTFQLEQLVAAGVTILDALRDLQESESNLKLKNVISDLYESVLAGATLAEAFEKQEKTFGRVYVYMVYVGEQSGQLPKVLHELANMIRWQDELIAKAKSVTRYPSIVFVVITLVTMFLMVKLVPQLIGFLQSNNLDIPFYTQALIATSDFFVGYWYWLILVMLLGYIGFKFMIKSSQAFKYRVDGIKLKIPVIGAISMKIKMARFAKHFGLMYASGVNVLNALDYCRPVVDNEVLDDSVKRAKKMIEEGASIADGFTQMGVFPSLILRMMRVGEASGELDKAMLNVASFYEREVNESIRKIEPFVMPVMTLFLALILLWVLVATLMPLYDSFGEILG